MTRQNQSTNLVIHRAGVYSRYPSMERLPGLQTPPSRNGILFNRTLLFSFFFIFLISWLVLTYTSEKVEAVGG